MIPLWKGKNPIHFGVIRSKVKVSVTINRIFDNRIVLYRQQGLRRIFCQRDYGPLLDHIKGPFQRIMCHFKLATDHNFGQLNCVLAYALINIIREVSDCFSDVGVSVPVDSLDCSSCISDPVFVFPKFSLSTSFVVFLTKGSLLTCQLQLYVWLAFQILLYVNFISTNNQKQRWKKQSTACG